MPFKSRKRVKAHGKRWRRRHPGYMRDYGKWYRGPGKKMELAMAENAVTESLTTCHPS